MNKDGVGMSDTRTNLEKGKISSLLFKLSLPAIIAQIVNVLYNMVDRIFIGRLPSGDIAMAGVGIAFPIILIVSAFSALIGSGGAPLCSIKMGEKDNDGAEKIMSNSFSMLIIIGIILTVIFLIFKEPILWAFGASEATIGYAEDYLTIYLIGTVFVQIALGMNPFINTQGFAKMGMYTVMIGAAINIVLDPIFIFVFSMGVKGAALATIIAQMVSALWVLWFLFGKKSILKLKKNYLIPKFNIVISILGLGVSPFIMQLTESLVLIALNNSLQIYGGDLAVGSMTIMGSIMQIIYMPLMGLAQGAQPIIGYNYGAKNFERVRKAFKLFLVTAFIYTTILWLLLNIAPEFFVKIFSDEPELVDITAKNIKVFFFGIFMLGVQIACQRTFLSLGQAKISLFLALLRKVILLIPLIFIMPNFLEDKLLAVLVAEPIADILAAIITLICFIMYYKKLLKDDVLTENFSLGDS